MTKACVRDDARFGVCRIVRGDEVRPRGANAPEFAPVGTLARFENWDMPRAGNPARERRGRDTFRGALARDASGRSHRRRTWRPLAVEPRVALGARFQPLAQLLELLAARVDPRQFPDERSFDDASWVGYRLAELLPLPASIKQTMLEINDAEVRLSVLQTFLKQHDLL